MYNTQNKELLDQKKIEIMSMSIDLRIYYQYILKSMVWATVKDILNLRFKY